MEVRRTDSAELVFTASCGKDTEQYCWRDAAVTAVIPSGGGINHCLLITADGHWRRFLVTALTVDPRNIVRRLSPCPGVFS